MSGSAAHYTWAARMPRIAASALVAAALSIAPAVQAAPVVHHTGAPIPKPLACSPNSGKKVSWHGGEIRSYDFVRIVFWGSWWRSHGKAVKAELADLYRGLGSSDWARAVTQYCYGGSGALWPNRLLGVGDTFTDPNKPPPAPSKADLGKEAGKWVLHRAGSAVPRNGFPLPIMVIVTPPGSVPAYDTAHHACGHHDATPFKFGSSTLHLAWIDIPYGLIKRGNACGWGIRAAGAVSVVASHEWAEAVTDPYVNGQAGVYRTAWVTSLHRGHEIADLCEPGTIRHFSNGNAFTLKLKTGRFLVQKIWSNAAGKHGACVKGS